MSRTDQPLYVVRMLRCNRAIESRCASKQRVDMVVVWVCGLARIDNIDELIAVMRERVLVGWGHSSTSAGGSFVSSTGGLLTFLVGGNDATKVDASLPELRRVFGIILSKVGGWHRLSARNGT